MYAQYRSHALLQTKHNLEKKCMCAAAAVHSNLIPLTTANLQKIKTIVAFYLSMGGDRKVNIS